MLNGCRVYLDPSLMRQGVYPGEWIPVEISEEYPGLMMPGTFLRGRANIPFLVGPHDLGRYKIQLDLQLLHDGLDLQSEPTPFDFSIFLFNKGRWPLELTPGMSLGSLIS